MDKSVKVNKSYTITALTLFIFLLCSSAVIAAPGMGMGNGTPNAGGMGRVAGALPPGLAKRDTLPPGLANQATLPPGLGGPPRVDPTPPPPVVPAP